MLHLRSEAELEALGLPPHLLEQAKRQLAPQIPDVGDLRRFSDAELWAKVEAEQLCIRRVEKEIAERGMYVTAARYRQGVLLLELKLHRCKHGEFEAKCKARRISSQRASENMGIAEHFRSEAEAGKVPVRRALALIRSGPANTSSHFQEDDGDHPPIESGDASTDQWLFDRCNQLAVEACDEPITLDAAAAEWNHKCKRYFTKAIDGLTQEWNAKAVWCNPPFSARIIEAFVRKALHEAQHGTTTICLVPRWNSPYLDLCERHGRIHRICGPVSFRRQDGTEFTLNNQYPPLIVVMFGPTIQPGCGSIIRKGDTVRGGSHPKDNGDIPDTDAETACDELVISTGRAFARSGLSRNPNAPSVDDESLSHADYSTPMWLFRLLDDEFHFTLDPAALPGNAKCAKFYTKVENGLIQSWANEVVWLNPPFGKFEIGKWVKKAYEESRNGATVVLLVPTCYKGYKWWQCCCTQGEVRFVHEFVQFVHIDGKQTVRKDVTVIVLGSNHRPLSTGPAISQSRQGECLN